MNRAELLKLSGKGVLACLGLSALGIYFSSEIAKAVLPLLEFVIRLVTSDYSPLLKVVRDDHDALIQLDALVMKPLQLTAHRSLRPGTELTAGTHILHVLAPVVVELSILLTWPVRARMERITLIMAGLVASLLLIGLTTPFILMGNVDIALLEAAQQAGESIPEPWPLRWMIICEMGGCWVLAVGAVLASIRLQTSLLKATIMRKWAG